MPGRRRRTPSGRGRHRAPRAQQAPRVPLWLGGLASMAGGAALAFLAIGAPWITGGLVLVVAVVIVLVRSRAADQGPPIGGIDSVTKGM